MQDHVADAKVQPKHSGIGEIQTAWVHVRTLMRLPAFHSKSSTVCIYMFINTILLMNKHMCSTRRREKKLKLLGNKKMNEVEGKLG